MVVEENDLLGAKRELAPEFTETARIVGIHDDPEVASIPKLHFAGAKQDIAFGINVSSDEFTPFPSVHTAGKRRPILVKPVWVGQFALFPVLDLLPA